MVSQFPFAAIIRVLVLALVAVQNKSVRVNSFSQSNKKPCIIKKPTQICRQQQLDGLLPSCGRSSHFRQNLDWIIAEVESWAGKSVTRGFHTIAIVKVLPNRIENAYYSERSTGVLALAIGFCTNLPVFFSI